MKHSLSLVQIEHSLQVSCRLGSRKLVSHHAVVNDGVVTMTLQQVDVIAELRPIEPPFGVAIAAAVQDR